MTGDNIPLIRGTGHGESQQSGQGGGSGGQTVTCIALSHKHNVIDSIVLYVCHMICM